MTPLRDHIWKSRRLTALLIVGDALALGALWLLSWRLRSALHPWLGPINPFSHYIVAAPLLVIGWIAVLGAYGHYSHRERVSSLNQLSRVMKATMWCLWWTVVLSFFLLRNHDLGRSVSLIATGLTLLYLYSSRTLFRHLKQRALLRGEGARRVLVVGAGALGRRVLEHLNAHPEIGFSIVGFVKSNPDDKSPGNVEGAPVLGDATGLNALIGANKVDEVFFADPTMADGRVLNLVVECEETGAAFKIVSDDFFRVIAGDAILEAVDGIPVTRLGVGRLGPVDAALKRAMDLVVTVLLAPVWLPAAAVIALLILIEDGRSILFSQRRVGLGGDEFTLWKFRTMRADSDPYAVAPTDPRDARVTRVGRFLRKTSLDEIPQFWNVLNGSMSMVGPRPEMPFLVKQYEEWQRSRLDVKPGLTGLWQVVGRKNLPLEFNIEYDLWYIRNRSLLLDFIIVLKTVPAVLFGRGAF